MSTLPEALDASLEAIRYRANDRFVEDLTAACKDLLTAKTPENLSHILRIIKTETGLNFAQFILDPSPYPAASCRYLVYRADHVLDEMKTQLGAMKVPNATPAYINWVAGSKMTVTDRGHITGIIADLPSRLRVTDGLLNLGITPQELAAVIVHEVGHVFNNILYIDAGIVGAMAIAELEANLAKSKDAKERRHYIDTFKAQFHLKQLPDANDPESTEALKAIIVRDIIDGVTQASGVRHAHEAEVEYLADSYAVRMGLGRPLVSVLLKIARANGDSSLKAATTMAVTDAARIIMAMVVGASAVAIGPAAGVAGVALCTLMVASLSGSPYEQNTLPNRLDAIQQDLVRVLKDREISKEMQDAALKDVDFVRALREEVRSSMSILDRIYVTLMPSARKRYKQAAFAEEIQRLVDNDLYRHAAKFSQMARKAR